MYKKDFINLQKLIELTGYSRGYLYKKMRQDIGKKETPLIIKEKGKTTLYHVSLVDTLKGKKETGRRQVEETPPNNSNFINDNSFILEQKEMIEKELKKVIIKLENEEKKFGNLLEEMNKRDQRHDTIVMTMSKQLEALNNQLLLIEDKTKEPEGFFRSYGPSINQALIFLVIVLIYIKILYL